MQKQMNSSFMKTIHMNPLEDIIIMEAVKEEEEEIIEVEEVEVEEEVEISIIKIIIIKAVSIRISKNINNNNNMKIIKVNNLKSKESHLDLLEVL